MSNTDNVQLVIFEITVCFVAVLMVRGAIASISAFIGLSIIAALLLTTVTGIEDGIGQVDSVFSHLR